MQKIKLLFVVMFITLTTQAQLLLVEDFDYPLGSGIKSNGWTVHSGLGATSDSILVVDGLIFSGYPGSGIGGAASVTGRYEDQNKVFTSQTSGTTYAAFMFKSLGAGAASSYFLHFAPSVTGTTFFTRVWINSTGNGIGLGDTAPASFTPITINTTYLIVIKYDFSSKTSSLYVLNSLSSTEPTTAQTTFLETRGPASPTPTDLGSIALRQGQTASISNQNVIVDGIRIATSWANLISFPGTISLSSTSLTNFDYTFDAGPSAQRGFSVSGLNLTGNLRISAPINYEISTNSGGSFVGTNSIIINPIGGKVDSTIIYTRLKGGLAVGTYSDSISIISTGALSKKLYLYGSVVNATPIVNPDSTIRLVSISPATAKQGQTLAVTITGVNTHFNPASSSISFSQASGTIINPSTITKINDTSISASFTIPTNASTGYYNVNLSNSLDGSLTLNNGFLINIDSTSTKRLVSVSPAAAKQGQTLAVTITGVNTHFNQASSSISFSQASGTIINPSTITKINDTSISASFTIPTNASTGYYNVNLSNSLDGSLTLNNGFLINIDSTSTKRLVSVSPATAKQGQTLAVTITGVNTHFNQASSSISFSQASGTIINPSTITKINDTSISASFTIPANASTGYYNANLGNSLDGSLTLNNGFLINIDSTSTKRLVSVSPATAKQGQTLAVTITGVNTHFNQASSSISFSQASGTIINPSTITKINDTSISASFTIPANASTGYYNVNLSNSLDGSLTILNGFQVTKSPTTDSYAITLQISTGGTVTESNASLGNDSILTVNKGTTKIFTFTPNVGYQVGTLTYNGADIKSQLVNNQYTTAAVNANATLIVTFKKSLYQLSIKSTESGTVNLLCEYGATPLFNFTASSGWKVNTVLYNGTNVTSSLVNGVYTVPAVSADALLTVSFELYTALTVSSYSNVKVYTSQSEIIVEGTSQGEAVSIYTSGGVLLQTVKSQGDRLTIKAEQGAVYLVKTASKTVKVVL